MDESSINKPQPNGFLRYYLEAVEKLKGGHCRLLLDRLTSRMYYLCRLSMCSPNGLWNRERWDWGHTDSVQNGSHRFSVGGKVFGMGNLQLMWSVWEISS